MREVFAYDPLSVFIPSEYGRRGGHVKEGQSVLEATGYESLGLTVGAPRAGFAAERRRRWGKPGG